MQVDMVVVDSVVVEDCVLVLVGNEVVVGGHIGVGKVTAGLIGNADSVAGGGARQPLGYTDEGVFFFIVF